MHARVLKAEISSGIDARGVVEPDELPFDQILGLYRPYLGALTGVYTDWTPLVERGERLAEDMDLHDPWQFKNFRVT